MAWEWAGLLWGTGAGRITAAIPSFVGVTEQDLIFRKLRLSFLVLVLAGIEFIFFPVAAVFWI